MTDLERAALMLPAWLHYSTDDSQRRAVVRAVIESVLLKPSEEVVEAATNAIIAGDRIQVQGSGLEPSTEALRPVYRDFARAALKSAALASLGREGSADG